MECLRVALVGPYPEAEGKVLGGVQAVTSALADGLAAVDGIEVNAVTLVEALKHAQCRVSKAGVHVHLVPLFGRFGCLTGFAVDGGRVRRVLRQIAPDIVHVHGQLLYGHAAIERGWPSILTIHGIAYREKASVRGYDRLQSRLGCAYEAGTVGKARHIGAINHYSINAFDGRVRADDIRFIDNPIDDRYFEVPDNAEPGRILFGGFVRELKNLMYLLEALAMLSRNTPISDSVLPGR